MTTAKKKLKTPPIDHAPEEQTLVPECTVSGYEVRPWTLAKLIKLTSVFERVRQRAIQQKVSIDLENNAVGFAMFLLPDVPEIMAITIDISVEEAENMVGADAVLIILTILRQNVKYLKNLVGPLVAVVHGIIGP